MIRKISNLAGMQFDPEIETISEFLERLQVQFSDILGVESVADSKKSTVLIKALPVNIITDLQRGLKPKKLSEATFSEIKTKLEEQFKVKKSIIGASVSFISRKQKQGESIEQYAQALNHLADDCNYSACCRSRYLRDIFVAGLSSDKVISSLLHHDCDTKSFKDVVEKAKTIEAFTSDVENIKCAGNCNAISKNNFKNDSSKPKNGNAVPYTYVCIRCGQKAKHFANKCFALNLTCSACNMRGHPAKCCKNKKKAHNLQEEEESASHSRDSSPVVHHTASSGARTTSSAAGATSSGHYASSARGSQHRYQSSSDSSHHLQGSTPTHSNDDDSPFDFLA